MTGAPGSPHGSFISSCFSRLGLVVVEARLGASFREPDLARADALPGLALGRMSWASATNCWTSPRLCYVTNPCFQGGAPAEWAELRGCK